MASYQAGTIHGIVPQHSTAGFLARGVSVKELLIPGPWRSSRAGCRPARYTAARAQPLPASSNAPSPPPPRPPPPFIERAGDLTDRLLKDYLSGWTSQYTEYDYYVPAEAIDGTVPDDIRGTLFLVGPGLTEAYGTSVRHPSDGDGMVCSLAFGDGGQIFFRNRYVRTTSFVAEQALSRRLTRGFHDRGAALVNSQQQQQQQPPASAADQQQRTQQQQRRRGPQGGKVSEPGAPKPGHKAPPDGRAAAERTGFEEDAEDDYDARRRASAAAAGAAATGATGPSSPLAALAAAATAAAGGAVPKQLRLDPLALLGLPPPPPLSSLFNPLDLRFRTPANASVVHWGGRLLAFTEGGSLPYELNKLSLETVGLYDVAGAMADIGRLVGGYKIAPAPLSSSHLPGLAGPSSSSSSSGNSSQRLVVMGAAQSGPDALLRWVEVGEDGSAAGPATTYRMPGALAQGLTDFWVTDRYYVVVQAPLDFNPQRFATEATLGAVSFAECFDWDSGRASRVHLVPRPLPQPTPPASVPATSAAAAAANSARRRIGSTAPIVWPPQGPTAIVVEAPPLLPISCVGCYSLGLRGQVLVFDAICQQGLSGTGGGTLDSLDPGVHWRQPKPELTRLVVDLHSGTATARVLSQRAASAATTAAAGSAAAAGAATAASRSASLPPVGHGASFVGGYHHLYASASATEAAEGWAPSQVLLKLALPPEHGVTAEDASGGKGSVARRRGVGAEVWSPGHRTFVGPPVFVPRKAREARTGAGQADPATVAEAAAAELARRQHGGGASPLPPLESEVEAAARRAGAAATARRLQDEQDGWLLVMVHDAAAMVAELCVLDARDVTRGPVAVISLPHHLPHMRHGCFTRSYCGPGLAAPPGWRPRTATTPATAKPPVDPWRQ